MTCLEDGPVLLIFFQKRMQMLSIGLTGFIASGKSTVAKAFADRGIDIICSDTIAKFLTLPGKPALQDLIKHFGQGFLLPTGELDRKKLRACLVKNDSQRLWLENLLHPLIQQEIAKQVAHSQSVYCLIEIPILYKKEDFPYLNRVLLVECSESIAIKRLMERDNCSYAQAKDILMLQRKNLSLEKWADDVLQNNGSREELEHNIEILHQKYLALVRDSL